MHLMLKVYKNIKCEIGGGKVFIIIVLTVVLKSLKLLKKKGAKRFIENLNYVK